MDQGTEAVETEPDYSGAIGRTEVRDALIAADRVAALASTLDLGESPVEGAALPPGWHWIFFNPFVRRSELGPDGHPKRGGFLPDVGLPRRMWAGGRLNYLAKLPVGARASRKSEITKVAAKSGRAGRLVFVTIRHTISHDDALVIEEEQDIVYREAAQPGTPTAAHTQAPDNARWSECITPDPVLLFRYSALTSNGHRIHYDRPYAQDEEGYSGLVVHGPLISTLLQGFAERCREGAKLSKFEFRAMAPLFVDRGFHIEATDAGEALTLWARGPDGELAMRAEARFGRE